MPGTTYPIVLTNLHEMRCVVVGGGIVAERKVAALLDSAAMVTVISPELTVQLRQWTASERIHHINRTYVAADIAGVALVIAATDDPVVNAEVAQAARRAGILVNVVDDPAAGNFHTVATVRQGDVLVTVSTGGFSPAVAALLRRQIEDLVGPEYAELLDLVRAHRTETLRELPAPVRRQINQYFASETMVEWLKNGNRSHAEAYMQAMLDAARAARWNDLNMLGEALKRPASLEEV
jgi:siroheme synthase-like protein